MTPLESDSKWCRTVNLQEKTREKGGKERKQKRRERERERERERDIPVSFVGL